MLASFTVTDSERALRVGDALVVFRATVGAAMGIRARVFDLSAPTRPRRVADVTLPLEYLPYPGYRAGSSSMGIVAPDDGSAVAVTGDRIVFLKGNYGGGAFARSLVTLDLTSIASPTVTETPFATIGTETTLLGLVADDADGDVIYVNAKTSLGQEMILGTSFEVAANVAQRWVFGAGGWTKQVGLSIPGVLIKSFTEAGAAVLLTHDTTFERVGGDEWKGNSRLNLAANLGTRASILDAVRFRGQQVRDLCVDDGRMFVNLSDASRYWGPLRFIGPGNVVPSSAETFDSLAVVGMHSLDLRVRSMTTMTTESAELMGVYGNTLFFSMIGTGIVTVDVGGALPTGTGFLPIMGYANQIEVAGGQAFVPEGLYGIHQFHL